MNPTTIYEQTARGCAHWTAQMVIAAWDGRLPELAYLQKVARIHAKFIVHTRLWADGWTAARAGMDSTVVG